MQRAKEIFVYAPVGLAMYLRDTAPSFLKVFVARGRAEFDQKKRSVGDQVGQARDAGAAAADTAPQVLRLVTDGLSRVKETAEGALAVLGTFSSDDSDLFAKPARAPEPAPAPAPAPSNGSSGDAPALAIPDYDALSASQVVDRLEGLSAGELEAIRSYEVANRGRATILGKIEQLTRAS